ncbi:hypothetical protein SCHPADRAFT_947838 [Schizopora paradoxa]|uniref:Uncharacterized protein n=1 Tax=Schizopora paradoxa TaxID=27342 RepID=A0A0H2R447_9AGAM|nr:hypothetical protein SCHPADRAFT_947838 [Schizopora paradoxa]
MPKAPPPPPKSVKKLHEVPMGTLREWARASGERVDISAATLVYKLRVRNEAGVKKTAKGYRGPCREFHKYNEGVNGMNAGYLLDVCIRELCEDKVQKIEIPDDIRMKLANDIHAIQHFAAEYKREDKALKQNNKPPRVTTTRKTNVQVTAVRKPMASAPEQHRSPSTSTNQSAQVFRESTAPPSSDSDVYYTANTHPSTSSDNPSPSDGCSNSDKIGGPHTSPVRPARIIAPIRRKWPRPSVPFLGFEDDEIVLPKAGGAQKKEERYMPQYLDGDSEDVFPEISDVIKEKKSTAMFIDLTTPKRTSKRAAATEPPVRQKKFRPAIIGDDKPKARMPALFIDPDSKTGVRAGPSAHQNTVANLKPRIMDKALYREVIEILDSP